MCDVYNITHLVRLQRADLLDHEVVEVRMESVDGTVDADRHVVLAHFDEERGDTRRRQMSRPPRHDRADVPHVLAVLVRRIPDAQLSQNFSAIRVLSLGIAEKEKKKQFVGKTVCPDQTVRR